MPKRESVGLLHGFRRVDCTLAMNLTNDNISREHILPEWLAAEVHQPELTLKHYRHSEDTREDEQSQATNHGGSLTKPPFGNLTRSFFIKELPRPKKQLPNEPWCSSEKMGTTIQRRKHW